MLHSGLSADNHAKLALLLLQQDQPAAAFLRCLCPPVLLLRCCVPPTHKMPGRACKGHCVGSAGTAPFACPQFQQQSEMPRGPTAHQPLWPL